MAKVRIFGKFLEKFLQTTFNCRINQTMTATTSATTTATAMVLLFKRHVSHASYCWDVFSKWARYRICRVSWNTNQYHIFSMITIISNTRTKFNLYWIRTKFNILWIRINIMWICNLYLDIWNNLNNYAIEGRID